MPLINGRFYLNPATGSAMERARIAEQNAPTAANPDESAEASRDSQGRFSPAGPIDHVHIEVGDGGFVAHLHHAPPEVGHQQGITPESTAHVFADHNHLVEFLRNKLGVR